MLTVTAALGPPGIIESGAGPASGNAARRRRSSHRANYQRRASSLFAGKRSSSVGRDNVTELNGISMDRLTYMNTALDALPGFALREYFVPIMRLKKQLLLRQRRTKARFPPAGSAPYAKLVQDAIAALAKALSSAGGDLMLDGGTASLDIDPNSLAERLQSKLTPICMEAGSVLGYPREPPEASFVYVVVSGTVTAMYFQPQPLPGQQRRGGGGGAASAGAGSRKERQTYFTSAKDTVRLCGGGMVPDAALLLDDYNNNNNNAAGGTESGGTVVEAASMSNVTTAIQRSLRRASRTVGQPTLQYTRMEQLRGPVVLGATEALGLAPSKYVSYTASAEPSGPAGGRLNNITSPALNNLNLRTDEVEVVQAFRVRTADVHRALIQLAVEQQLERQAKVPFRCVPWCAAPPGEVVPRGATRTIADFIVAARRRSLYNDYAAMELMMRQSWLLQDAPSHTIRTLIAHLEPHTYMPGEVIACPHTPGGERQLCFLRRGSLNVYAVPKAGGNPTSGPDNARSGSNSSLPGHTPPRALKEGCDCWHAPEGGADARPAEVVESGASFGELSVLFQEPRHCVLRAATVCDAWCLPHRSFTSLMQRDASLRDGLLKKAAVLRIEWMSEQRFTRTLAQQLRASSELLRPLPDIAIRLIQERLEPVVYAPGSLVVSMSTQCNELIFIMHGTVATICAGVATYGPGDVLGEGCLVPHRWPLGLAARTMVEGWRIKADQLSDALRRMDKLQTYSGLVTSQTSQLMKQIFGTPQPEIEVDAVGRQRMPTVGPAPGGMSHLAYGRAVSEVQLRAICFLYRDFVRWEDINYSTIDGDGSNKRGRGAQGRSAALDTLARELAIQRLDGGKGRSVAAALTQQHQQEQQQQQTFATPRQQQQQQQQQRAGSPAAGVTESPVGKENEGSPEVSEKRKSVTSAVGSGRNAVRASSGQVRKTARAAGGNRGQRGRVASAGAFLVKSAFLCDDVPASALGATAGSGVTGGGGAAAAPAATATTTAGSPRAKLSAPLPPRLQRMRRLLEERNRTWAAEQRHEATLVQQEASQREAAVRDQVALHASTSAAAAAAGSAGGHRPTSRGKKRGSSATRTTGTTIAATAAGAAAGHTHSPSPHFSLADVRPAPVHIFLQSDKPKYELDLKEAISIGYVMQLPDIAHIQYSVSLVDPDVALGPPAQRARRHLMSITPNDRYNKHNFLFAAAALEDGNSAESQKAAAEAAAEATLRSKARKLYTMMRTAVAARMDVEVDPLNSTPHRNTSGDYSPDIDSASRTRPPETLVLADDLQVRSPHEDTAITAGLVRSPHVGPSTPSPKPRSQPSAHQPLPSPSVVRNSSVATPSPFRGSPGKHTAQRSEEALLRMLQREPVQAIDLLRKHYGVPWSHGGSGGGAGNGLTSGQSSPARYGTDSRSANGSGYLSSAMEASGESQRRAYRPSLLDRIEAAAAGGNRTTSPSGLPRVLPSRDAFHGESRSLNATTNANNNNNQSNSSSNNKDGSGADAEELQLLMSGEVVLTNNTALTFPPLVCATARDRWHGGNHLTPGSAPPAGSGGSGVDHLAGAGPGAAAAAASADGTRRGEDGGGSAAAAATAAAAPDSGTLSDYFYSNLRRRFAPVLFVEGYGPLQPLPEEWLEYPPAIHVAAAAATTAGAGVSEMTGGASVDRAGATSNRLSRPASAIAAAAALRRSTSRPGTHNSNGHNDAGSSSFRATDSVGGHGFNSPGGAYGERAGATAAAPPRMERFTMPSMEDTEVVIRRIQRDVNGLNAVARDQRRERDVARLRNGRVVKHRAAVEAALGKPDEQEQELLEMWRSQFARIDHDALRRASVPAALSEQGGPDYMRRELRQLASAPVPMEDALSRYTKDMQMWQEQQQHGGRGGDASPLYLHSALNTATGGNAAAGGGGGNAQDGPRRVMATIGTSRMGFAPTPLQNPTALMTPADTQAWARQREDFFAAYKDLLEHPGKRATTAEGAAPALAPPTLRFTPAPPTSKGRPASSPPPHAQKAKTNDSSHTNSHQASGQQDNTSYTAAFADFPTTPMTTGSSHKSEQRKAAAEKEPRTPAAVPSSPPSDSSPAVPSVASAASLPSVPSPMPAMDNSAELQLRRPKPELPSRYDETPIRSFSSEHPPHQQPQQMLQATPPAVDHRVAVTPPRDTWNGDDTQDYMDGSAEYTSGGLEEGEEEEEEEGEFEEYEEEAEEDEHSAVLGGPDMVETTTTEDGPAENGAADGDKDGAITSDVEAPIADSAAPAVKLTAEEEPSLLRAAEEEEKATSQAHSSEEKVMLHGEDAALAEPSGEEEEDTDEEEECEVYEESEEGEEEEGEFVDAEEAEEAEEEEEEEPEQGVEGSEPHPETEQDQEAEAAEDDRPAWLDI